MTGEAVPQQRVIDAFDVRSARKHVCWYLREREGAQAFLARFFTLQTAREQLDAIDRWFERRSPTSLRDSAANESLFLRSDAA